MMNYVSLQDCCEIVNGYAFKSEKYVSQGIRIIRITNVQRGRIVDESPRYYPFDDTNANEKYKLVENDLLISLTGNVGRTGLLPHSLLPAALNQRVVCLRLRNDSPVTKEFIFHYLNRPEFENDCILNSTGVAQKNLSSRWLKEYKIPVLAPLLQQKICGTIMLIDRLLEDFNIQLALFDDLIKSRFAEMFEYRSYEKKPIAFFVDKRIMPAKKQFKEDELISYIDISAIDATTREISNMNTMLYSESPTRAQQCVQYNDLLISTVRPGLRRIAQIRFSRRNMVASSGFCVLRSNRCPIEYIREAVLSDRFTAAMCKLATGASYPAIKTSDILSFRIPNAPLKEIELFAAFARQIDKLRFDVQKQIEKLSLLKQSLMQEYFG